MLSVNISILCELRFTQNPTTFGVAATNFSAEIDGDKIQNQISTFEFIIQSISITIPALKKNRRPYPCCLLLLEAQSRKRLTMFSLQKYVLKLGNIFIKR